LSKEDERRHLFSYVENRFGIPQSVFGGYLLFKRHNNWWLLKNASPIMAASQLKVTKFGIRAFRRVGRFIKPTTKMIQIFGEMATKARREVGMDELLKLQTGEKLTMPGDLENGYVILKLQNGSVLGLGLLIDGKIRSQLPNKELRLTMLKSC
jgi:NOL1/NOP2/fmu family ribosome biogenesis protein